jgi:uncharacterized protein involved in exopolysaccharide biosynthesis
MNNTGRETFSPVSLVNVLRNHPWRWLGPAIVIGAIATLYAAVRPDTWSASQTLIVRGEAVSNGEGLGWFDHADQMKSLQETILEVARSRDVLRAALTEAGPLEASPSEAGPSEAGPSEAGPSENSAATQWPTDDDIDKIRQSLTVTPPKGAEFGSTEIFYLSVEDHGRRRAVVLTEAICDQLQKRLKSIRDDKATSMEAELVKASALARDGLERSTVELSKIEREAGSDLVELRILSGNTSGESSLRRTITDIRAELRTAQSAKIANQELLAVLKAAQGDPGVLMAAPNRLFETQPSLKRLKDGLVDAQLETARLRGNMLDGHPAVMTAIESEREIGQHLHNELDIAVRGLKAEINMDTDRIALLNERLESVKKRLGGLAEVRAAYANLVAETAHRSHLLEQAEQNLARARASKASADAVSLISRVGTPDTGSRPVGPGRAAIALMGLAGGLLAGFGLVLLGLETSKPGNAMPNKINGRKPAAAGRTSILQALQKVS